MGLTGLAARQRLSTEGSIIVNLTYSEEQAAYAAAARHFADEVLVPISQEFNMDEHLSADEVQSIRSRIARYEIATVPPARSDGTLDLVNLGIFIEEVSRVNVGFGAIFQILFFPISTLTSLLTAEQREAYGYIFGSGGIASIAVSEPNAGSNPRQMETLAEATDDGWVLNGQKLWISFADIERDAGLHRGNDRHARNAGFGRMRSCAERLSSAEQCSNSTSEWHAVCARATREWSSPDCLHGRRAGAGCAGAGCRAREKSQPARMPDGAIPTRARASHAG